MNTDPSERLEHAARQAADGVTPQITEALGESEVLRDTLDNLRVLSRVAQVHRTSLERSEDTRLPSAEPLFTWGTLRVMESIGGGSFGDVYRALDPALGRDVALKLRPTWDSGEGPAARRWLEEARRIASVRHPNVVQVYGAAIHDARPGLWMELIAGQTLEQQLEQRGPLGWREACAVGIELCAALAAVHAAGLLHQDVKASNVMREGGPASTTRSGNSGRIVLMDFGAGQRLDQREQGTGSVFGTPLSMAPEVLAGQPATPRSDLYSLGVLLYRLVTGRHPIETHNVAELLTLSRSGGATALRSLRPELPADFVAVVERALAVDPAKRWPNASEFERALSAAWVAHAATESARAPEPNRNSWPIAGVVVAVVLLGVSVVWFVLSDQGRLHSQSSTASRGTGSASPSHSMATKVPTMPGAASPTVDARFLRAAAGGAEEIHDGDLVAPGDQLALSIKTRENLWVYVLNEDRVGSVNVLFPVAGLAPTNPLANGEHRLPGVRHGHALDWRVTSAGGRESFLFIASRTPLTELESRIATVPRVHEGAAVSYARLDDSSFTAMRGVSGLAPSRIVPGARSDKLESLAALLTARADSSVWIRRVMVANPGP